MVFDEVSLVIPSSLSRDDYRLLQSFSAGADSWKDHELAFVAKPWADLSNHLIDDQTKRLEAVRSLRRLADPESLDFLLRCLLLDNDSIEPEEKLGYLRKFFNRAETFKKASGRVPAKARIPKYPNQMKAAMVIISIVISFSLFPVWRAHNLSVGASVGISFGVHFGLSGLMGLVYSWIVVVPLVRVQKSGVHELIRHVASDKSNNSAMRAFAIQGFVVTKRGYIGMTGSEVQYGDKLVFFEHSTIPFLLREKVDPNTKKHSYFLQGDCYVHELMRHGIDTFSDLPVEQTRICI